MPDDAQYLEIILSRVRVCKSYKPRFGQGQKAGLNFAQFQELYGADPFYAWFNLDNRLIYAAHKAAGGITSVYRQIGIGCEALFRQILRDQLSLSAEQARWSYVLPDTGGKERKLALDARIGLEDIASAEQREIVANWMNDAAQQLEVSPKIAEALQGCVFEVRQGYKSKDSKRQNADIANAAAAFTQGYLPIVLTLSSQIDYDIVERYRANRWLILRGYLQGTPLNSTYSFMRDVVGYDLAGFFERNRGQLQSAMLDVLETLLSAHD